MSRWEDEFKANAIHQTLIEARGCLDVDIKEPSASLTSEKRRILKILDFVEEAVGDFDPEITPSDVLTNLNNHIRYPNFWNQIQAFKSSTDISNLTNANAQIDTQLSGIYQRLGMQKGNGSLKLNKSVEKSFADFTKTIELKSKEFSSKVEKFESELTATTSKQEVLNVEMDNLAANHKDKLNEWVTEFTTKQSRRSEEFSEAQITRTTKFEEWFAPFQKDTVAKADTTIDARSKTLVEFFNKFKTDTDEMRLDAENRHRQILELHGLVAGDGVVAGYVDNAEAEKEQANFWRWVAVAFITATAIWLGYTYVNDVNTSSEAGTILSRLARIVPLTAVFLYGAVYASKQSTLHRNNEKQTRWFALEVKAIDPFIAALEPDQQKQLKEKLTERIFGQNNGSQETTVANVDPNLLKVILDAVKDVAKAK